MRFAVCKRQLPWGRERLAIVSLIAAGASGVSAWVNAPLLKEPLTNAAGAPVLAGLTQPPRHLPACAAARRPRGVGAWGRGGGGGGHEHRKSFVSFFSVAVLSLFGWAGKPQAAAAEESPSRAEPRAASTAVSAMLFRRTAASKRREAELRDLLLDGDVGRSRRDAAHQFLGRALGEMSDSFPFPPESNGNLIVLRDAAEGRKHGRRAMLSSVLGKEPRGEGASANAAPGLSPTDVKASAPELGQKEVEEDTAKLAAPEMGSKEAEEDSAGGILGSIFGGLKSLIAAIFGARGQPAQEAKDGDSEPEDDKDAEAEVSGAAEPGLEFPNPEEWLESARDAALRLPLVGAVAPEQKPESVDDSTTAPADTAEAAEPLSSGESSPSPPAAAPAEPAQQAKELSAVPPPDVPGLAKADLVVQVEIEPKERVSEKGKEAGMARLMAQSGGAILSTMASSGWKVEAVDTSKGLFEISLPSVRYDIPGATMAIPSPRFLTTIRDSYEQNGEYKERLQGDLVLQNGKDILTVELGFPVRRTFAISAAGWTRSRVGWRGDTVICSNFIELGLQLPKVPGLASIMQYFVTSYGTESTQSCAFALSKGANELAVDEPTAALEKEASEPLAEAEVAEQQVEIKASEPLAGAEVAEQQVEIEEPQARPEVAEPRVEAEVAEQQARSVGLQDRPEAGEPDQDEHGPEWWESARNAVSESARGFSDVLGAASTAACPPEELPQVPEETEVEEAEPAGPEWWESARDAVSESARGLSLLAPNGEEEAVSTEVEEEEEAEEPVQEEVVVDVPPPVVPGMGEANLVVHTQVERKTALATETEAEGVTRLMSQPGGAILATMAQEGWKVEPVDESTGLFEISLPSVRYELPGAVVSIPPPRFLTTVRDTFRKEDEGSYEERLQGDLVLQNGQDILTVELGFPFRTTFTVSAAGWCRAFVGWERDAIGISTDVEIGLQLPKFPGLEPIMKYFVKSYGTESTEQCAAALARGADELPADAAAWLSSGVCAVVEGLKSSVMEVEGLRSSVMEALPELPSPEEEEPQSDERAPEPRKPSG